MGRFLTRDTWSGILNRPQSLNRWMYLDGNPINYIDPTGHIKEGAEANDAEKIVNELKIYNVFIKVDWGYSYRDSLPNPCGWNEGLWSLSELDIVKYAVESMSANMKGRFTSIIGTATISKVSVTACGVDAKGCSSGNKIEFRDKRKLPSPGYPVNKRIIDDTVNFDVWSVVHEFGHVWNNKHNGQLGVGLENATGGFTVSSGIPFPGYGEYLKQCDTEQRLPGCNDDRYFYGGIPAFGAAKLNRSEDFANSFAAYVFPSQTQRYIADIFNDPNRPEYMYHDLLYYADYRKTPRWNYINNLVSGYTDNSR